VTSHNRAFTEPLLHLQSPEQENLGPRPDAAMKSDCMTPASSHIYFTSLNELQWPPLIEQILTIASSELTGLCKRLTEHSYSTDENHIAFTSQHPGEGRTTLAMTLTHALTREHDFHMLIIEPPDNARSFLTSVTPKQHFFSHSSQKVSPHIDLIVTPSLVIARTNEIAHLEPDATWHCLEYLFGPLSQRFDLILSDMGPMQKQPCPQMLSRAPSCCLWIHNSSQTPERDLQPDQQWLQKTGIPILGIVENRIPHHLYSQTVSANISAPNHFLDTAQEQAVPPTHLLRQRSYQKNRFET